jgi:uncharacterized membrane protein YfcA
VLSAVLTALGFVGGFLSGLLGIGGGIVMVPLLLFVPRLLGLPALDMRHVAGLTIVQVFAAACLGYVVHRRRRASNPQVVRWMGPSMVGGTGLGGALSDHVTLPVLEAVFVALALVATPLLFFPPPADEIGEGPAADFPRALAVGLSFGIGVLSGLVGVGGAFLVIPVMVYLFGIPTRAAIGSSLGLILMASVAGLVAKVVTGQVIVPLAAALVVGTLPGSWVGATVSRHVSARRLRLALAVLVAVTAVRMLVDVLAAFRYQARALGTP